MIDAYETSGTSPTVLLSLCLMINKQEKCWACTRRPCRGLHGKEKFQQ